MGISYLRVAIPMKIDDKDVWEFFSKVYDAYLEDSYVLDHLEDIGITYIDGVLMNRDGEYEATEITLYNLSDAELEEIDIEEYPDEIVQMVDLYRKVRDKFVRAFGEAEGYIVYVS